MHEPDAVVRSDRKARDLTEDPVAGQRLRPERLGLEARYVVGVRQCSESERGNQNAERAEQASHGGLPENLLCLVAMLVEAQARFQEGDRLTAAWQTREPYRKSQAIKSVKQQSRRKR